MDLIQAILLGIVQGITEFLPVSSTGHLILFSRWMGTESDFSNMFNIVIQFGAILALPVIFGKRLLSVNEAVPTPAGVWSLWSKVAVAVAPALLLGFLFSDAIETFFFHPGPVAAALALGGVALLFLDGPDRTGWSWDKLGYKMALLIGLFQCLALFPGMSRSGTTIIGALLIGASRKTAAEFSFFLALPVLAAASGYSLLKYLLKASEGLVPEFSGGQLLVLVVGFVVSFGVAWAVSKWFLGFITKRDFRPFGWYRICLAIVVGSVLLFAPAVFSSAAG